MSEKIEKFIRINRREFDEFEPPANLWEKIEQQLDEKKPAKPLAQRVVRMTIVMKAAAIVLIMLTTGLIVLKYQQKQGIDISKIDPEMGKLQVQYASMIESKQLEMKQIEKENPALYKEFESEIKKMDSSYQKLKSDLATSPNREETVNAMIRNLQTQIDVLNQQLTIIQQINKIKKGQTNETQRI